MKFKYEKLHEKAKIDYSQGIVSERLKVFGGWIVRHICWSSLDNLQSESSVFVPDQNHEWLIDDEES